MTELDAMSPVMIQPPLPILPGCQNFSPKKAVVLGQFVPLCAGHAIGVIGSLHPSPSLPAGVACSMPTLPQPQQVIGVVLVSHRAVHTPKVQLKSCFLRAGKKPIKLIPYSLEGAVIKE